ncbi:MAG: hypothetical protein ABSA21_08395 [Candidatus Limnocylindrales bacterium]|jgi:hypothetical protein
MSKKNPSTEERVRAVLAARPQCASIVPPIEGDIPDVVRQVIEDGNAQARAGVHPVSPRPRKAR